MICDGCKKIISISWRPNSSDRANFCGRTCYLFYNSIEEIRDRKPKLILDNDKYK